jgi:TonB family protein
MKAFLLLIAVFLTFHSKAQNNLLMATILDGNGIPAKEVTIHIRNSANKLLNIVQTDSAGNFQFRSSESSLSLDIRSNKLEFKSMFDDCYLLPNDTTQKLYVLLKRNPEEVAQLERGLKKLSFTETGNLAKITCPNFLSGMEDPEKQKEIHSCLISNLTYPQEAVEAGVEGKVYIKFVVDENEQIRNMEIIGSAYAILEEEALRAAACLSGIGAATCEGKKVPTMYTLPVSFRLN